MTHSHLPAAPLPADTADSGRIVFGGGYRLPAVGIDTADAGRIIFGGGYRLPADRKAG
ncbi:MAG TPA: hypothetical protein VFA03_03130 [Acetobacteraceae bacterium]|nr:hypothetical protein [Acetobacteraceae bacterium]